MSTSEFDEELERRIALLESSGKDEQIMANLPVKDVAYAFIGLAILTILLLTWGYGR